MNYYHPRSLDQLKQEENLKIQKQAEKYREILDRKMKEKVYSKFVK